MIRPRIHLRPLLLAAIIIASASLSACSYADLTEKPIDCSVDNFVSFSTSHLDDSELTTNDATIDDSNIDIIPATDISLDFKPYTLNLFSLPNEDSYKDCGRQVDYKDNVLGHTTKIETLNYYMNDGTFLTCIICTDTNTDEIFLQESNIGIYDINDDGCCEAISDKYLWINTHNGIMVADVEKGYEAYLKSILSDDVDYSFNMRLDINNFFYTVYTRDEEAYEYHTVEAQLVNDGYAISYERTSYVDFYAPYESNDPNWNVEVSYTDIPYPNGEIYNSYTLTITGPDDKKYIFSEDINFKRGDHTIRTDKYQDIRFDRKLIVHPDSNYAILIFPVSGECSDDINMTNFILIDLENGNKIDTKSAYLTIYYLFETDMEANEALYLCDSLGMNKRVITEDVNITEKGFSIDVYLRELNGDIIKSGVIEIDLDNLSTSVSEN